MSKKKKDTEFKKDIQEILKKFDFDSQTRRKIFSLVMEHVNAADRAEKAKKGNQK